MHKLNIINGPSGYLTILGNSNPALRNTHKYYYYQPRFIIALVLLKYYKGEINLNNA